MKAGTYHHSPETRAKISAAKIGKLFPPERRASHRTAMSRPEVREKLRQAGLGKPGHPHSPETRAKMSAALKGKPRSPERRASHRAAMSSPETRAKIRAATRAAWSRPETRAKMSAALIRGELSPAKRPEVREKISAAVRAAWSRPETRAKMSGERNHSWRGGISFEPYCPKFNNDFKERVRAFWGRTCCLCLASENGKALSVHHVHANKEACCSEESPRQFVALCASCHSKVGGVRKAKAEEYRVHFQEMIALRGGRSY